MLWHSLWITRTRRAPWTSFSRGGGGAQIDPADFEGLRWAEVTGGSRGSSGLPGLRGPQGQR